MLNETYINAYYKIWNKTGIDSQNGTYYIISNGTLRTKDSALVFEKEDLSFTIPPEATDTLGVYSNVSFSPSVFEVLNKNSISLNMYDRFGTYIGSFIPVNNEKRSLTAINQMKLFCDDKKRLKLATKIESAAAYNIIYIANNAKVDLFLHND